MRKIITLILLAFIVLALVACTDNDSKTPENTPTENTPAENTPTENTAPEITMQDIYDASQINAMLQNHQNVLIQDEMDGEVFSEKYLTKEYVCFHYPDDEFNYAEFLTDDARYAYNIGDYLRYLYITPEGVTNDFSNDRAEFYTSVLDASVVNEPVESVSQKDGNIVVNTLLDEEAIEELLESEMISVKNEYRLDAEAHEMISITADCTYADGTFHIVTEVTYDAEEPEIVKTFLGYANQTENLRNVTIVTNPDTDKEISQSFRIPKGLYIGFSWPDAYEDKVELYADAACTELYDAYVDTESDLTVYVKWAE